MKHRLFSLTMAALIAVVLLSAAGPALAASGTGTVTCEGDGVVTFAGDVRRIDISGTGSVVYSKQGGVVWKSGNAWKVYHATGEDGRPVTIMVGWGEAHGVRIVDARVVLSAANGFMEVTGSGTLYARGEGYCETEGGIRYEWNTLREAAVLTIEE